MDVDNREVKAVDGEGSSDGEMRGRKQGDIYNTLNKKDVKKKKGGTVKCHGSTIQIEHLGPTTGLSGKMLVIVHKDRCR